MTLTPTALPGTRGLPGRPDKLSDACAHPSCHERAKAGHHVYPRSHLRGQPYDWIELPDGRVLSNRVPLCLSHHNDVTGDVGGHRARLDWHDGDLAWIDLHPSAQHPSLEEWIGPLDPQPAEPTNLSEDRHDPRVATAHVHLAPGQTCDSCGYTKPVARQPGPKRKSSSWTVIVPDDAEDGAEILDAWVEDFAAVLGLDPQAKRLLRYHVLAVVLAWASQNISQFIYDVKESGDS